MATRLQRFGYRTSRARYAPMSSARLSRGTLPLSARMPLAIPAMPSTIKPPAPGWEPLPWNEGGSGEDEFRDWCRQKRFGRCETTELMGRRFAKAGHNPIPRFARKLPQNWNNLLPWQLRYLRLLWNIWQHCKDKTGETISFYPPSRTAWCHGFIPTHLAKDNTCTGIPALGGLWAYTGKPPSASNQPAMGAAFQTLFWWSNPSGDTHYYYPVARYAGIPGFQPREYPWRVIPRPEPSPAPKPGPGGYGDPPVPPIGIWEGPPGPGVKERKTKFHSWIGDVIGTFTEVDDFLECACKSIDAEACKGLNSAEKMWFIYQHWGEADIAELMTCMAFSNAEDDVIGWLGRLSKQQLEWLFEHYGMDFFRMHVTDQIRIVRELMRQWRLR